MSIKDKPPNSPRPEGAGACALVFSSCFALLALLFILSILTTPEGPDAASIFMPFAAFIAGNIFAIVALVTKSSYNRWAGRLALRILWGSLGLLLLTSYLADHFMHRPKQ